MSPKFCRNLCAQLLGPSLLPLKLMWYVLGWGRGEPIYVSVSPWFTHSTVGTVRNLRFTNILCRSECGVYICADQLGWIEDVVLDGIRLELSHWSGSTHPEEQGGFYDRRPTPGVKIYKPQEGIAGFHLENIRNVTIKNSRVVFADKEDYWANAVYARGCEELTVDVAGKAAKEGLKAIDIA